MEIFSIIVGLIFIAFLQAESEFIKYRPSQCLFPMAPWYIENIWDYTSKGKVIDWLMRYPLSFAKDGFHFIKSTQVVITILLLLTINQAMIFNFLILDLIVYYIIYGIAFNVWYHKWYKL